MCEKHLCVHAEFSFLLLDLCAELFHFRTSSGIFVSWSCYSCFSLQAEKELFFFFSLQWIKKHKVKHVNKTFSTYRYLYGFEEYCRSANIQFRTIHHNEPKVVEDIQKHEEPMEESVKEEQKMPPTEVKKEAEENYSSSESEKEEIELRSPRVSSSNWFLFST